MRPEKALSEYMQFVREEQDKQDRQKQRELDRLQICLDAANADIRELKTIAKNAIAILESSRKTKTTEQALDELFKVLEVHTRQPEKEDV